MILIKNARNAWRDLLTKLNAAATFALTYLALNGQLPPSVEAVFATIHQPWQFMARLFVPIGWGTLIEYAKAKAVKKAA